MKKLFIYDIELWVVGTYNTRILKREKRVDATVPLDGSIISDKEYIEIANEIKDNYLKKLNEKLINEGKVKLVSMKNEDSFYKKYLGKIFTIKQVGCVAVTFKEATEENISPYLYNLQKVEEKYTYEDLKKSPVGTKITFEDGNVFFKDNEYRYINIGGIRINEWLSNLKDNMGQLGKIIKIEEPTYKTVYEHKEEILDETEKRYLSSVIRPFRDKIKYIIKVKSSYDNNFYIRIVLNNDVSTLPYFKKKYYV